MPDGDFDVESLLVAASKGKLPSASLPQSNQPNYTDVIDVSGSGSSYKPSAAPGEVGSELAKTGASGPSSGGDVPPTSDMPDKQPFDVEGLFHLALQGKLPPPPPEGKGITANLAAGANRTIFGAAGKPVDLVTGGINAGLRGIYGGARVLNGVVGGQQPPEAPQITNPVGGSDWISQKWGELTGTNPQDVQPVTEGERMAAGAGSALAQVPIMALGGAGIEAAGATGLTGQVAGALAKSGGETAGQAAITAGAAGVGGATGQLAEDEAPPSLKPYAGIVGNVIGAGGVALGAEGVARGVGAAAEKLGSMGVGPKDTILNSDGSPVLDSSGKPLRATRQQAEAAVNKITTAAGPDTAKLQTDIEAPGSPVPGVERTLAQQSPSPGIVNLDTAYRTAYPSDFNARGQSQGQAMVRNLQDQAPESENPTTLGQYFTSQLDALKAERDTGTEAARGAVQRQAETIGGNEPPETYGATIASAVEGQQAPLRTAAAKRVASAQEARQAALAAAPGGRAPIPGGATVPEQYGAEALGQAMTARQAAVDREGALWGAINPDGTAGAYSAPFKERLGEVYGAIPQSAVQPSGEEAAILKTVQSWPDLVPLTEVQAMRSRIGDAISKEIDTSGKTPTVISRRLIQAKGGLDQALEQTLDAHDAIEQQSVASGQMSPEQTMVAKLQAEVQAHVAAKRAATARGNSGQSYAGNNAGGGQAGVRGAVGSEIPPRGGSGNVAGGAGVSSPLRPLTAQELEQARAARAATQQRAQTFDEGVAGDLLAPGDYHTAAVVPDNVTRVRGGFSTQDAEVLDQIWNGKRTEAANLRAAQAAGISPDTLRNWAADDLRSRAIDSQGNFDPAEFAKWQKQHAAGLHVFPEVNDAFTGAAQAQHTVAARQAEAAAIEQANPLRGIRYLSEVPGKYLQAGDTGADAVRQFASDTGAAPDAMRAFDDYAIYRMRNEPGLVGPDGLINATALDRFRGRYSGALSQRPELNGKISSLSNAQTALDQVEATHKAEIEAYQNGIAKSFLNDDPQTAIRKAFSVNPTKNFRQIVNAISGNPDAAAALRRGVVDFIVDKMSSAKPAGDDIDLLKAAQFRAWVRHNGDALKVIFGDTGVQNIERVAGELRRQAFAAEAASGSATTQRIIGAEKAGLTGHGSPATVLGAIIGEHAGEMLGTMPLVGSAVGAAASKLSHVFGQAGISTTNDLVKAMLLHVPVAKAMMEKVATRGAEQLSNATQRRVATSVRTAVMADTLGADNRRAKATQQPPGMRNGGSVSNTTPEAMSDLSAQLRAVADRKNPKDAMFVARGSPVPKQIPSGLMVASRREGTLITTNRDKAQTYRKAPTVDDAMVARLLGYPETKSAAVASGAPHVVQSRDGSGNVITEALASPSGLGNAVQMAQSHGHHAIVTTPDGAQIRRAHMIQQEGHG